MFGVTLGVAAYVGIATETTGGLVSRHAAYGSGESEVEVGGTAGRSKKRTWNGWRR